MLFRSLTAIEQSKAQPFEKVLYAIGIRHVGERTAKELARSMRSIQAIRDSNSESLQQIPEIGAVIADSIVDFFKNAENGEIVNRMMAHGLQFKLNNDQAAVSSKLSEYRIVITGTFSGWSREELKNKLEQSGAQTVTSVSKKTTLVIAGSDPGPEKIKKAADLNIKVISEVQLEAWFTENLL